MNHFSRSLRPFPPGEGKLFSKYFGHWIIGIYLRFACLPVGREFGSWNCTPLENPAI
jgi:hypothetical protein